LFLNKIRLTIPPKPKEITFVVQWVILEAELVIQVQNAPFVLETRKLYQSFMDIRAKILSKRIKKGKSKLEVVWSLK